MKEPSEKVFLQELNQNLRIVHKVANIYFLNSDEREDVIQEMIFNLWKGYSGFQGNAKFTTWMYKVCLNTAITWLKNIKKNTHESISDHHFQMSDVQEEQLEESFQHLYKAIEKLSIINKAIILLYLEDQSYDEIAKITGLTKSNVSVRLVRIKKELEKEISKNTTPKENAKLR